MWKSGLGISTFPHAVWFRTAPRSGTWGRWATPGGLLSAFLVVSRETTRLMNYAGGAAPSRARSSEQPRGETRSFPPSRGGATHTVRRRRLRGAEHLGTIGGLISLDRNPHP